MYRVLHCIDSWGGVKPSQEYHFWLCARGVIHSPTYRPAGARNSHCEHSKMLKAAARLHRKGIIELHDGHWKIAPNFIYNDKTNKESCV